MRTTGSSENADTTIQERINKLNIDPILKERILEKEQNSSEDFQKTLDICLELIDANVLKPEYAQFLAIFDEKNIDEFNKFKQFIDNAYNTYNTLIELDIMSRSIPFNAIVTLWLPRIVDLQIYKRIEDHFGSKKAFIKKISDLFNRTFLQDSEFNMSATLSDGKILGCFNAEEKAIATYWSTQISEQKKADTMSAFRAGIEKLFEPLLIKAKKESGKIKATIPLVGMVTLPIESDDQIDRDNQFISEMQNQINTIDGMIEGATFLRLSAPITNLKENYLMLHCLADDVDMNSYIKKATTDYNKKHRMFLHQNGRLWFYSSNPEINRELKIEQGFLEDYILEFQGCLPALDCYNVSTLRDTIEKKGKTLKLPLSNSRTAELLNQIRQDVDIKYEPSMLDDAALEPVLWSLVLNEIIQNEAPGHGNVLWRYDNENHKYISPDNDSIAS